MATSATEVERFRPEVREQAEAMLAAFRQRIAQAMNRLGIGHESPRLIEAHVRFAVTYRTDMRPLDDLKMLELERLVFDAQQELDARPELVSLYRERANDVFKIPEFAYVDTELADPDQQLPPIAAHYARAAGLIQ